MSSSIVTWNANATRSSTASVGLAAPDSMLAHVARGIAAIFAICACVMARASRSVRTFLPSRAATSSIPNR